MQGISRVGPTAVAVLTLLLPLLVANPAAMPSKWVMRPSALHSTPGTEQCGNFRERPRCFAAMAGGCVVLIVAAAAEDEMGGASREGMG
jgi:hypothetical protein